MKTSSLIGLLAISLCAAACAGAPEGGELDAEIGDIGEETGEDIGEASDALTVTTSMGSLGWAHQTPLTSDLVLTHRVSNVYNKWGEVATLADFPSLEGLSATQSNIDTCKASRVEVYVYKRASGSSTWTSIDQQKRYAKATVSNGKITSCEATFETSYCSPYLFGGFDAEMKVDVLAFAGDGQLGRKTNVVRYPVINLANCN